MAVPAGQTRYAAFYYGWFTSGIGGNGHPTSADAYPPVLAPPPGGPYDSSAAAVMEQHAAWALQAHLDTFLCSEWGKGHAYNTYENTTALLRFLDGPTNPHPWLKVAAYYELEQGATNNPTAVQLTAHLEELRADMFSSPSYRRVDGNPVVFVYDAAFSGSGYSRWTSARAAYEIAHPGETVYLGLPIWNNGAGDVWTTAAALNAPDMTFHKYAVTDQGTTVPYSHTEAAGLGYSFTVSPGFHNPPAAVVLQRSAAGFAAGIASGLSRHAVWTAIGQGLDWVLVTSFNELGEGTNVEPSTGFGGTTAQQSTYLDIMAGAFPFPSTGIYPDFQISTVSTTTLYHDISDYIRAVDGVQTVGNVEQTTPFGQSWHLQQGVSKTLSPVTLEGFYDDTSGALARLHVPGEVGSSIYLRSVFGPGDAIEARCVVKSAQRTAKVRQLTGFALELAPTGQPSTGIA